MNSLSWMIYIADVVGSIGALLCTIAIFSGIAAAVLLVVSGIITLDGQPMVYSWEKRDEKIAARKQTVISAKKYGLGALKICVPVALAATFIPSSSTVYAIAASQVGEKVLTSATGDKAVRALNAWLDKQIAPEDKKN